MRGYTRVSGIARPATSGCFKRKLCPGCGNFARLPVRQFGAVCRACERLKPCVRCHRAGRKIGRLTPDGPACDSCAFYFREPEPCEACGKLSRRLSRKASLGHGLRVCDRCARSDQRSCQACLHHRPLTRSPDGLQLCAVCLEKGEIPCPKCYQPMPAGCGRRCRACYWTEKTKRRIETDSGAFSSPALTGHFQAFGEWLIQTVGGQKGALHIHKYLEFFLEIERKWNDIPDYESLLGHFSAGRLRRFQLPMRWMEETGLVRPDANAREADSDQRRIEANLDKFRQGISGANDPERLLQAPYAAGKSGQDVTSYRAPRSLSGGVTAGVRRYHGLHAAQPEGARWIPAAIPRAKGSTIRPCQISSRKARG